ncbi:SMC-Scp complex subunit ScpB [Candidatus Omnitrophota bacterium]
MSDNNVHPVIEAVLFSSDKPVTLEQLKNTLESMAPDEIRSAIEQLMLEYEKTNRGMRIIEIAGGFQMVTSSGVAPFLKKFYKKRHVERLSKPALETLAIIAYKQPSTKLEIEAYRGVNVDGVMYNLLDKGLVRISGRRKAPGRPFVFSTSRQFLEYFGLKSLEELPKMEDFSALVAAKEGTDETEKSAPPDKQA